MAGTLVVSRSWDRCRMKRVDESLERLSVDILRVLMSPISSDTRFWSRARH